MRMGIFGIKNNTHENASAPAATKARKEKRASPKAAGKSSHNFSDFSWVLKRPRVTEKAARQGDHNTYVFEIAQDATKTDVVGAVKTLFKVTPKKVTIVNHAPRRRKDARRGRWTTVSGLRKAQVTLKKGEVINVV
jgi:large subunit ribosomal protein L23